MEILKKIGRIKSLKDVNELVFMISSQNIEISETFYNFILSKVKDTGLRNTLRERLDASIVARGVKNKFTEKKQRKIKNRALRRQEIYDIVDKDRRAFQRITGINGVDYSQERHERREYIGIMDKPPVIVYNRNGKKR